MEALYFLASNKLIITENKEKLNTVEEVNNG